VGGPRKRWAIRQVLASVRSPRVLGLALAHLCSFGVAIVIASWLTAYFVRAGGLDHRASLLVSAVVVAGGAVGRFAGGAALGRVPDRELVAGSLTCSGIALAGLALSPSFPVAPLLAFLVLGCCSLTYGSIIAMALGSRPPQGGGKDVAAMLFVCNVPAAALPAIVGWMVDRTGSFAPGFALLAGLTGAGVAALPRAPRPAPAVAPVGEPSAG